MNRVGLNLVWMVPGTVGGSESYLTRLLSGLAEGSSELDFTVFALPSFAGAHPELARTFEVIYAPVSGRRKALRVAGENSWLAYQCRRRRLDLVHHGGGILPLVRWGASLLTIHDLQYLEHPGYFSATKLQYLKRMVPRSIRASRFVLTPSEFTRSLVVERMQVNPDAVVVIPHGIGPVVERYPGGDLRSRYDLPGPFFLYPAFTYPHKNHLVLIEAFTAVLKDHPDLRLVLTGGKGSAEAAVFDRVHALGVSAQVKRLGYISHDDLDSLYLEATATTFPSRYEGFGAPVLEAMARGCPVIAADAAALPEVIGRAGRLVAPDDVEGWAGAMNELIDNDGLRRSLSTAGVERARRFTWSHAAGLLQDTYRLALRSTL
ncbi:MAG: glycosyltransferase family 4 protein [Actinomycetota bacterium]|nr:glycosyltransferase family 4 protein [Actinomycetota bacterium]